MVSLAVLGSGAEDASPYFSRGLGPLVVQDTRSAAACGDCHRAIYQEWAESRHAKSWTNSLFRSEYEHRPLRWCVNCHAPNDVQQSNVDGALAAEGVSCQTCHVRRGRIHAARKGRDSPHETVVVGGFGNADWCGGCHQFNFPVVPADGQVKTYTQHPMQDTVRQFQARNSHREVRDCRGCHATSASAHAYPGAHSPAMLERALGMEVCRDGSGDHIEVWVRNRGAGHNVPTGDVHRHIAVRVWRPTAPERLYEGYIGRRYEPLPAGGRRTVWDSTLAPGAAQRHRVSLSALGGEDDESLHVELRYVYVAREFPTPGQQPDEPTHRSVYRRRVVSGNLPVCEQRARGLAPHARAQDTSTSTSESDFR